MTRNASSRGGGVTSYDVARAAGVSQATVSRVLNGNTQVSPAIRERVLEQLEILSYVPNASAQSMRTAKANAIGIVASEILNPYFPRLLDALTREARDLGLNVLLWNDDDPDAPMAQSGAAAGTVDGIIFATVRENTRAVERLAARGFPVVVVNRGRANSTVDCVSSDHESSGYAAADYFIRNGKRNLAAVFGPRDTFASPARESGFRGRLSESQIIVPPDRWLIGETTYEHGCHAAELLLRSGVLPDAVFCSADIIAFGLINTLRANGVHVPDDLWVMGNDDLPMSEWGPFDLTTHRQPIDEIAQEGLKMLVERIDGDQSDPRRTLLSTELIVRGSTDYCEA